MGLTCRICQKQRTEFSPEHVPPQSTGNTRRVVVEVAVSKGGPVVRRNGVAVPGLCRKCNEKLGSRLGTSYSDFVRAVQGAAGLFSSRGEFVARPMIYPSRVLRQLALSYLCAQHPHAEVHGEAVELNDALRAFVRIDGAPFPADRIRVGLYHNVSATYRLAPTAGVWRLGTQPVAERMWLGTEVAAPGLGVLFTLSGLGALPDLAGVTPYDVTGWAEYGFKETAHPVLRLQRLRVEHPHPLAFGRPRTAERWRDDILWMVNAPGVPGGPPGASALWRRKRQRR